MKSKGTGVDISSRERLSALMDAGLAEGNSDRAIQEISRDNELRDTWERYHLIGDCLRGEPFLCHPGLAARVERQIEIPPETSVRVPVGASRDHRKEWHFLRLVTAAAATVAVIALVPTFHRIMLQQQGAELALPERSPIAAMRSGSVHWDINDARAEVALNMLLVEHSEFTTLSAMNGLASYAKFVGYDTAN